MTEGETWRRAVRDAWNAAADVYDAAAGTSVDFYRTEVIGPGLLAACGSVSGLTALDLGCGQGYFSRLLAKAGARVIGVDISERLIEHAVHREREDPQGIEYVAADAADIASRWPPASFDLVVSCIALQDMADPLAALRAANRLLKPGGRVVILVEHPTNDTSYREWERDAAGRKIVLRIDRYFDTGPKLVTWKIVDPRSGERREFQFPGWRRTIEQWSELFSAAGFLIARISEPRPTTEQVQRIPDLDDCYRIPYFLTFKLVPAQGSTVAVSTSVVVGTPAG